MLEPILITLFVIWLLGAFFFGYMVFFAKINKGRTIVDSAYQQVSEQAPVNEQALAIVVTLLGLLMVLGWPITLIFVMQKEK